MIMLIRMALCRYQNASKNSYHLIDCNHVTTVTSKNKTAVLIYIYFKNFNEEILAHEDIKNCGYTGYTLGKPSKIKGLDITNYEVTRLKKWVQALKSGYKETNMDSKVKNNPTPDQVKDIFKYTYLIYTKYKDSKTDQDFHNLLKECHELQAKYHFELCEKILLEVCEVIDRDYKSRKE
jgi:hypothetical protein